MEVKEEAGGGMEQITIKEYNSSTLSQCGKFFIQLGLTRVGRNHTQTLCSTGFQGFDVVHILRQLSCT